MAHPRMRFGQRSIDYRHYLRELARKPQAVRQVLPELLRDLGAPFPAVWARLEAVHRAARGRAPLCEGAGPDRSARLRAVIVPALEMALADHTPLLLAVRRRRLRRASRLEALPVALRDLEVASGCAADYDAWLVGRCRMSRAKLTRDLISRSARA